MIPPREALDGCECARLAASDPRSRKWQQRFGFDPLCPVVEQHAVAALASPEPDGGLDRLAEAIAAAETDGYLTVTEFMEPREAAAAIIARLSGSAGDAPEPEDAAAAPPPLFLYRSRMNETEWQKQLLKIAHGLGWHSMHIGRTGKYQAVGAKGTLGTGWPDLVLVKGGRIIFAELKGQDGVLTVEQKQVLLTLSNVGQAVCWRPSDMPEVLDTLAVS